MFCCLFLTLVLAGNLARASHDICTAIAGVNCGGGHDLVPLKNATVVSTPGACCAICQKTPQCNAWTWNGPHGNNMCYPKTACTKVGQANGHVSGSNVPIPPTGVGGGAHCNGRPYALQFVHVMKTGGTSLSRYLKCEAKNRGWVIRGTDWGKDKPFTTEWNLQNRSCEPTIVTQHAGVVFDDKVTNNTLIVVVLRDIAERVWSFYQYLRGWYVPFKKRPLEFFLQAGPTYDPSSDVSFAADKGCKICMHHLHNGYVWQLASYNCPNCGALDTMPYAERVVTEDIFQRACKNLKGVVTGTLEEIQDILAHRMDSFASQFPPPFKSKCTLPHSNPTKKKSALTDATRQAIMDANRWDERLLKECLTRRL